MRAGETDKAISVHSQNVINEVLKVQNIKGLYGPIDIDVFVSNDGEVYINEINAIPGSLSFYLWEPKGKKYPELLEDIIKIGIKNYQDNNNKVHSFVSNILAGYSGAKGAKGSKFGYKGSKF